MTDATDDSPKPLASDSIAAGDAAAAIGEWAEAVTNWERALGTPDRAAASQRLRWFLAENGGGTANMRERRTRGTRGRFLAVAVGCALLGTACVFLGQGQSGTVRNVLAGVAWALYIAAATLVVTYAFTGGDSASRIENVSESDVREAFAMAERLASNRHERGHRET